MVQSTAIIPYTGGNAVPLGPVQNHHQTQTGVPFVGLSNQGATCYMNSLLQNLYMTPEFRRALYSWKYDSEKDDEEEDCIPLQLQKLFAQLQSSGRRSVETRDLTKSFGWTQSDAFTQHDVQELCRVLFDALERTFKDTECATLVNDLYQGTLLDYVLCKHCHYESSREDTFLDISLVLKPFGSNKVMNSVSDSLQHFLKPEILEGDNKFFCEKCNSKQDAVKGMKLKDLPYLLTLQLKRFDFDYTTFQKIKLNDEVRFPMYLDMNEYVVDTVGPREGGQEGTDGLPPQGHRSALQRTISLERHRLENLPTGSEEEKGEKDQQEEKRQKKAEDAENKAFADTLWEDEEYDDPTLPDLVDYDGKKAPDQVKEEEVKAEKMKVPEEKECDVEAMLKNGPWVYELYAVLIHSGGAFGGHYYAYIKNFGDGKWYNFNDSTVSLISEATVKQAWGGRWGQKSYTVNSTTTRYYQSSANAYMLMYRKVDKEKNLAFPSKEELPSYVLDFVKKEDARLEAELNEFKRKQNALRLKLHYRGKDDLVTVSKTDKLKDVIAKAKEVFFTPKTKESDLDPAEDDNVIDPLVAWSGTCAINNAKNNGFPEEDQEEVEDVPLDCIRLRAFNVTYKTPQEPFLGKDEKLLSELYFHDFKYLFVETKKPEEEWETYDPNNINLFLFKYNLEQNKFEPPVTICISKLATVKQLKELASKKLDIPADHIYIQYFKHQVYFNKQEVDVIEGDEKKLYADFKLIEGRKLHVEYLETPESESNALKLHVDEHNSITIKYNLPGKVAVDQRIKADSRWTLNAFREVLGEKIGLDPNGFRLKRHSMNGQELKSGELALHKCQITDNTTLHVIEGKPLNQGEHLFKFYLFDAGFPAGERDPPPNCLGEEYIPDEATEQEQQADGKTQDNKPVATDEVDPEKEAEAALAKEGQDAGEGAVEVGMGEREREGSIITGPTGVVISGLGGKNNTPDSDSKESEEEDCGFGQLTLKAMPNEKQYSHLFNLVICGDGQVEKLRQQIYEKLIDAELIPQETSVFQIRMREKLNMRAGRVMRDGLTVRQTGITVLDGREIGIQILDQEERLHEGKLKHLLLQACWFQKGTWTLSDRYEVTLNPEEQVQEAGARLARMAGVDPLNLRVLKTQGYETLRIGDFNSVGFQSRWTNVSRDCRKLSFSNLFLMDGDMLVLQDMSRVLRPLTRAEQASLTAAKTYSSYSYTSSYSSSYSSNYYSKGRSTWTKSKESGIKIMSKKERQEEEKRRQEAEEKKEKDQSGSMASKTQTIYSKDDSQLPHRGNSASSTDRGNLSDTDVNVEEYVGDQMMHTYAEVKEGGGLALFDDLS